LTTGLPFSSSASTAQPSMRHCISPGISGSSRLAPTNAPAKSVPPDMLHQKMFCCAGLPLVFASFANCSTPQRCASSLSGEPVAPSARTFDRSPHVERSRSAFRQLAKNAAPAPKKVTPVSAPKRQSVPQSGLPVTPPGLPS
jgi:hypothetical protein